MVSVSEQFHSQFLGSSGSNDIDQLLLFQPSTLLQPNTAPGCFHFDKENENIPTFAQVRDSHKTPAAPASIPPQLPREPLRELSLDEQMLQVITDRIEGVKGTDFESAITQQHDQAIKRFIERLHCKQLDTQVGEYEVALLRTNEGVQGGTLDELLRQMRGQQ